MKKGRRWTSTWWYQLFLYTTLASLVLFIFLPGIESTNFFTTENDLTITIINVQSYPVVGGTWVVRFTTIGRGDLIITPVDGTTWNDQANPDLLFRELQRGDEPMDYRWINDSLVIQDYVSETVGYEISKVLTSGKHTLMFQFGNDTAYAFNDATNWWNANWGYRRILTIDSDQVDADLTNVPLLVSFTEPGITSKSQPDGDDITFVSYEDNSTVFNHQLELFNATTGNCVAWVNVTHVSATTNTKLWMYYGNSDCSSQEDPTQVWNSHYVGIWHLNESGSGSDYEFKDSTEHTNHGTGGGPATNGDAEQTPVRENGMIGYAQHFNGVNDSIFTKLIDTDTWDGLTVEAWINVDVAQGDMHVFSKAWDTIPSENVFVLAVNESGGIRTNGSVRTDGAGGGSTSSYGTGGLSTGTWTYISLTWDAGAEQLQLLRNGYLVGSGLRDGDTLYDYSSDPYPCFGNYNGSNNRNFDGLIDECRLSNVARNLSWIRTCYNNAVNTTTFFFLGPQENITDTTLLPVTPYQRTRSQVTLTSSAHSDLDSVTLWYRYSSDNTSWGSWQENNSDTFGPDGWSWTFDAQSANGVGYYEFYSQGKKSGVSDEVAPTINTPVDTSTWIVNIEPRLTGENPVNESKGIALTPQLSVTVNDSNDNMVNVTWWSNSSGPWQQFSSDVGVVMGSVPVQLSHVNSNFSSCSTTYWWSVNASDGTTWTNETYQFTTQGNLAPLINSIDIFNATGSKLDNTTGLLHNNKEYAISMNITDGNGWVDIASVLVKAWYDNGDDSSVYNQTEGGNLNMYLLYQNTTGIGMFALLWPEDEAQLVQSNCSESIINSTTRMLTFAFTPRDQIRWATSNGSWTDTANVFDDLYSWNFEVTVEDESAVQAEKKGEYGVDRYMSICPTSDHMDVVGPPGFVGTSTVLEVEYSSNYDFNMTLYFEENLTNPSWGVIPVANNVTILADVDSTDDITSNITFQGIGENHAVDIFTSSGIFSADGVSQIVNIQFEVYIPLGTLGRYSAHLVFCLMQDDS
jgi:hypothetical protein